MTALTQAVTIEAIDQEDVPEGLARNPLEAVNANQQVLIDLLTTQQAQITALTDEVNGDTKICGIKKKYLGWLAKGCGFLTSGTVLAGIVYGVKWAIDNWSSSSASLTATGAKARAGLGAFPPFDPQLVATIQASATLLISQPDSAFWTAASTYVTQQKPVALLEQLMWMNYTVNLGIGLMPMPFIWNDGNDKLTMITNAAASIKNNGLAATYAAVPGWTYNSQSIPRSVSAGVMALAISSVITSMEAS